MFRRLSLAQIHLHLGEQARTFEYLEKACEERDPWSLWIKVNPVFENLRLINVSKPPATRWLGIARMLDLNILVRRNVTDRAGSNRRLTYQGYCGFSSHQQRRFYSQRKLGMVSLFVYEARNLLGYCMLLVRGDGAQPALHQIFAWSLVQESEVRSQRIRILEKSNPGFHSDF